MWRFMGNKSVIPSERAQHSRNRSPFVELFRPTYELAPHTGLVEDNFGFFPFEKAPFSVSISASASLVEVGMVGIPNDIFVNSCAF